MNLVVGILDFLHAILRESREEAKDATARTWNDGCGGGSSTPDNNRGSESITDDKEMDMIKTRCSAMVFILQGEALFQPPTICIDAWMNHMYALGWMNCMCKIK